MGLIRGRMPSLALVVVVVAAAFSLIRPSEGAKLRVLALHGYKRNAVDFCQFFESWDSSILDLVEFTCINGPFRSYREGYGDAYVWSDPQNPGAEVAVASILDHIRTTGPYDGIFGHTQGGNLTGLLGGIIEKKIRVLGREVPHRPPRFVIIHESGIWEGLKVEVFTSPLTMKSFHMVGNYDVHRQIGVDLASKYANPILVGLDMPHTMLTPQYMDENFKTVFKNFLQSTMLEDSEQMKGESVYDS